MIQQLKDKGNNFVKTIITDMENANIVINKEWFYLVEFIETQDGITQIISKAKAEEKYGFKYIGNLVK